MGALPRLFKYDTKPWIYQGGKPPKKVGFTEPSSELEGRDFGQEQLAVGIGQLVGGLLAPLVHAFCGVAAEVGAPGYGPSQGQPLLQGDFKELEVGDGVLLFFHTSSMPQNPPKAKGVNPPKR